MGRAGACLAIPLLGVERGGAGVLGKARAPFTQSKANATRCVLAVCPQRSQPQAHSKL